MKKRLNYVKHSQKNAQNANKQQQCVSAHTCFHSELTFVHKSLLLILYVYTKRLDLHSMLFACFMYSSIPPNTLLTVFPNNQLMTDHSVIHSTFLENTPVAKLPPIQSWFDLKAFCDQEKRPLCRSL